MPDSYLRRDPDTGDPIHVTYYDVDETAELLHVAPATVRRKARREEWPHENPTGRRPIFTLDHIERIHELSTVDPDAIPEGSGPARLGTPMDDTDLEGVQ